MASERSGHPRYPDGTELDKSLYVVSCGYTMTDDSQRQIVTQRPRGRDDYHFLYVAGGSIRVWIQGQEQAVHEGTLIYYRPGDPQRYCCESPCRPEVYWLHFNGAAAEQCMQDLAIIESGAYHIGQSAQIVEIWESILLELQLQKPHYFKISAGYLLQLLTSIARLLRRSRPRARENEESWMRVLSVINNEYQSGCPVEEYANIVGLSKFRFIKNFKSLTGRTPVEYRNRVRVQHAQMLLQDTACSVQEIGELTGFESASYFSRAFKQYTGVSPVQYRKNLEGPGAVPAEK